MSSHLNQSHERLVAALSEYVQAMLSAGPRSTDEVYHALLDAVETSAAANPTNPVAQVPDVTGERARELLDTVLARLAGDDEEGLLEDAVADAMETDATWEVDDRIVSTTWLLDGAVFTRRLTERECAEDALQLEVDLDVLDLGHKLELRTPDGHGLKVDWRTDEQSESDGAAMRSMLDGPAGWLAGCRPGDLVSLVRRGSTLHLDKVDAVGEGEAESAALESAFTAETVEGVGTEPILMVLRAMTEQTGLFRTAVPPVRELLPGVGVEVVGAFVGRKGEQWVSPGARSRQLKMEALVERWRLEPCCVDALEEVLDVWHAFMFDRSPSSPEKLLGAAVALDHDPVLMAFLDWVGDAVDVMSELMLSFANALISAAPNRRGDGVAPCLLRSVARENRGDPEGAEADVNEALRRRRDHPFALEAAARFAADRTDLRRAVALQSRLVTLTSGPNSDSPFLEDLEYLEFLIGYTRGTGRNEPCPCGSGRKYKACCLVNPRVPETERVTWLIHKLTRDAHRTLGGPSLDPLYAQALDAAGAAGAKRLEEADEVWGVLTEASLFPGGVASYLNRRGSLLPESEAATLRDWLDSSWELYEVLDAEPGVTVTVRDVRTGESSVVEERTASGTIGRGSYLLAHLVGYAGKLFFAGSPVKVAMQQRETVLSMLDAGGLPEDVAFWLGLNYRPPGMQTREGDEIELCVARVTAPGGGPRLREALDATFGPSDDGEQWTEGATLAGGERIIRAFLRLEDDEVVVQANARKRYDVVLDKLREALPDLEVRSEDFRSVEDLLNDPPPDEPTGLVDVEDLPEEGRAALSEHMLTYEKRWLDENVPALGGLTPRQAADDPTRRQDLDRLLASFAATGTPKGGLGMDADRIRAALGM